MKRIGILSFHTCPLASEEGKETGGMNVYILELGRELAGLGHQVDVFTRSQAPDNKPVIEVAPGFRVIHLKAGPQEPVHKKLLIPYIDEFVHAFHEFQTSQVRPYDVIHAHYYLSGLIAMKIGLPFIMSFHTLALMKNLVARDETEKEDEIRIDAEMLLGENAKKVVANSESDVRYLQYLYGIPEDRLTVIPPGVNTALFRPIPMAQAREKLAVGADDKLIVFVGRIEPLKGIDMLLYATKIVATRNPTLKLCVCIVGGDISQPQISWSKTLQSLNTIRHTLHLSASVTFVGQQSQEVLPYYYNSADIVVMPSHYESFGMAALEAMSCGVPVMTTNAAGISSFIDEKHSALITSVNNPLLLANQIEYLLKTPEKRDQLGRDVRENVMDLTWNRVAKTMSKLYQEVSA